MKRFLLRARSAPCVGSALLLTLQSAGALPVFPGAVGFGTETIAGRNAAEADIYRVTNLTDHPTNPVVGSLRYGVEKIARPRVIIFNVSGVIPLQRDLAVRANDADGDHGFLTIAGQTAPGPGITLKNFGIVIHSHDVLIQHIAVRTGNKIGAPNPTPPDLGFDNKDCIKVEAHSGLTTYNVVLDHMTCSWAMDESASVWADNGNVHSVTFSNNIFAHPILNGEPAVGGGSQQVHSKGTHAYGPLVGRNSSNVTLVGNLMAFATGRNPLVRDDTAGAQVINNVVYRPGPSQRGAMQVGNLSGNAPRAVAAIGNVIIRHPSPFSWLQTAPATGSGTTYTYPAAQSQSVNYYNNNGFFVYDDLVAGAGLYLHDNILFNPQTSTWGPPGGNQWPTTDKLVLEESGTPDDTGVRIARLTSDPYTTNWPILPSASVEAAVLQSAGKFPGERDAIDSGLIANVQNRSGSFLNRLSDLGSDPWAPVSTQVERVLSLPPNPTGDADNDGYKNFEEWLHGLAAVVEGRADPLVSVYDTFEDGNINGWQAATSTSNWSVALDGSQVIQQSDASADAIAVLQQTSFLDQVVEAKMKITSFNGTNRFARIYGRYQDPTHAYYVTVRSNNTVELKKIDGTVVTTYDTDLMTVNTTDWYSVRLSIVGSTLTATVKNLTTGVTVTLNGSDPSPLPPGPAAIGTNFATARFDNVFVSPFADSTVQIADDFSVNSAGNWVPDGGTWSVTNGVYQETDNTIGTRSAPNTTATWTNQAMQARVKINSFNGTNRFAAVYARYQSPQSAYFLAIRGNNTVELKRVVNNFSEMIPGVQPVPFNVSLSQWYTLRIEVTGGAAQTRLKGYVNGVLVIEGTDSNPASFTSGKAALGTFMASAEFDDAIITTSP